mgnify:CR=1 FL=1
MANNEIRKYKTRLDKSGHSIDRWKHEASFESHDTGNHFDTMEEENIFEDTGTQLKQNLSERPYLDKQLYNSLKSQLPDCARLTGRSPNKQ